MKLRFSRWIAREEVRQMIVNSVIAVLGIAGILLGVFWYPILHWLWCTVLKMTEAC
jgi:hypothetical protein